MIFQVLTLSQPRPVLLQPAEARPKKSPAVLLSLPPAVSLVVVPKTTTTKNLPPEAEITPTTTTWWWWIPSMIVVLMKRVIVNVPEWCWNESVCCLCLLVISISLEWELLLPQKRITLAIPCSLLGKVTYFFSRLLIYNNTGDDGLSSTHVAVFCFHFTPKNHISCSFFARKIITIIMKINIVSKKD